MANYISKHTGKQIDAAVDAFLAGGGSGSAGSVEVDATLTQAGKAADAKATGDRLTALSEEIAKLATPESFGAKGDGVTDDAAAIAQALESSKTVVFDGAKTYAIGSAITIPADAHVDFRGATIIPKGNHDVIRVMPGSNIENLIVRCTSVPDWDSSAVILHGTDKFLMQNPTKISNVKLFNVLSFTDALLLKGNGFNFYAGVRNGYIEGLVVVDVSTLGFRNGMLFQGVEEYIENPYKELFGFIGANSFRGYWSYKDYCAIMMDGGLTRTDITNNIFTDLHIEPNNGNALNTRTSYGICVKDGFTNYFEGCLYDYFYGHTAIYFGTASGRNVVKTTDSQVLAAGFLEDLGVANTVTNFYNEKQSMIPYTATTPRMYGNQDDCLAFINRRADCTLESFDGEPVHGSLSNVFNPTPYATLKYKTINPDANNRRARITINCNTAIRRLSNFYLQFYSAPKSVKVTFYNNKDATVVYDTENNANKLINISAFAAYGKDYEYAVAKIVIELGGFNKIYEEGAETYGEWELARIMGVNTYGTGNTWLRRDGGEVYGNIKFAQDKGPVITGADGKLYMLTVGAGGTIGAVEVQEEEEEAPEVATLTPIMKAGATWYDADLAGAAQNTITSIAFNAAYESTGNEDASWACDEDGNGNIMAYRNGTEVVIKSTTGSEGVKLNADSSYMFANDGTNANFALLASISGTETLRADKNTSIANICQKNAIITSPIFIPEGVTDMSRAFNACYKLETPPVLPDGVLSLNTAFGDCSSLQYLPEIPGTVTNLNYAFQSCSKATKASSEIPPAVTSMTNAFRNCVKVSGTIEVNAETINNYSGAFDNTSRDTDGVVLTGTSPYLAQLAATNTLGKVTVAS